MDLFELYDRVISVLFPQRCVICGDVVAYDDMWCGKCDFYRPGEIDCDFECALSGVISAAGYEGRARDALLRLKGDKDKRAMRFFAEQIDGAMRKFWPDLSFDIIVPVPTNASRLKERGFNQAEALARYLSDIISLEICADALVRHEDSLVQHTLNREERMINAAKAYAAGNTGGIRGKAVLLVDDVVTTGATIAACSDKLVLAGAKSVRAVAATSSVKFRGEEAQ